MSVPIQRINSSPKQLFPRKGSKGFTLLELLVVVAIIGALAAIAIPVYSNYVDKARVTVAISTLDTLRKNFETFHIDNQEYPTKPIDFITGTDNADRTVFSAMLLDQINNDLDLTDVLYNTTINSYTLRVSAKDKDQTVLTLTPTDISKAQ